VFVAAAGAALPWLWRNYQVFGDPFYSVNPYYLAAKAGAVFSHRIVDGVLVATVEPLSAAQFLKGLAGCALLNAPYLLLLVLALFPGCAAVLLSRGPDFKNRIRSCAKEALPCALFILLAFHLAACLAWPALKLRYLVPAAPLVLILAWRMVLDPKFRIHRGWLASLAALLAALCIGARLEGSVHGEALVVYFLLSYLSMSLILVLSQVRRLQAAMIRVPALCLAMLCISAGGTWPGDAYFNLPPLPDFFGRNKEADEAAKDRELAHLVELLKSKGQRTVMGDPRIWHLDPDLNVVEPPKRFGGEDCADLLLEAARARGIRFAVLDRQAWEDVLGENSRIPHVDSERWILADLAP
jgi:hypothetical protein